MRVFNLTPVSASEAVYDSAPGLAVMRFIAFAYLYHYLNWFSKTSIIKWNRISHPRAFAIAALWLAAVGLYASGSRPGSSLVLSLSFLHGFLELPLNHRSFVNIGRELRVLISERLRASVSGTPSMIGEPP